MPFFSKKEQLLVIILVVVIFLISAFAFLARKCSLPGGPDNRNDMEEIYSQLGEGMDSPEENMDIMVHISGQVYNPGLVELKLGSRVIDAINLAGGLKKDADSDRINLARKLLDEEKIYIPKIGEDDTPIEVSNIGPTSGKININNCTKEELISLPGIGGVIADRIIEYRDQYPFKSIEDIMNVSGIGDKKFDGIKDLIISR